MKIQWKIERVDVRTVQELYESMKRGAFVQDRIARNVRRQPRVKLTRARIWKAHVMCLVTTQQASGPNSRVQAFLEEWPFPLRLSECRAARSLRRTAVSRLQHASLRRYNRIGDQLVVNLNSLEQGGWKEIELPPKRLYTRSSKKGERVLARAVAERLRGLGPKQSRNLIQDLGASRYEIPLDSRIVRWLNANDFPLELSATALADLGYYEFALDAVQELCSAAGLYPCVFDAAVFASYDDGEWTREGLARAAR